MIKYSDMSDEEILQKIREVISEYNPLEIIDLAGDHILYPNDELKQLIVQVLFVAGTVEDCYDEGNPEHMFHQRILRLYLQSIGFKISYE